jgi:hypothetical protein
MHRQQRQAREGLGLRALRRAVWNDEEGTGEAPQAPASDRHAPGSRAAQANAAWQELGRTAARDGWAKRFVLDVAHGRLSLPAGSAVSALSQLAVLDPDAVRDLLKQAHPVCAPVVAAALGQACGRFHGELVGAAQGAEVKSRLAAVAGFAEEASHGYEDAVEELATRAGDPAGEVRFAAIAALGRARGESAVLRSLDRLRQIIRRADQRALASAASGAAMLWPVCRREALDLLKQIASSGMAGKSAVAAALREFPRRAVAKIADDLCADGTASIRAATASALSRWAREGSTTARRQLLRMRRDTSSIVRAAAVSALAAGDAGMQQAAASLAGDRSALVRVAVAETLVGRERSYAAAPLQVLAFDRSSAVRGAAQRGLAAVAVEVAAQGGRAAGSAAPGAAPTALDPTDAEQLARLLSLTRHRDIGIARSAALYLSRSLPLVRENGAIRVAELICDETVMSAAAEGIAAALDADPGSVRALYASPVGDALTPRLLWAIARSARTPDAADLVRSAARVFEGVDDLGEALRDLSLALTWAGIPDFSRTCTWLADCADAGTADDIAGIAPAPDSHFQPAAYLLEAAGVTRKAVQARSKPAQEQYRARALAALDICEHECRGRTYGGVIERIVSAWRDALTVQARDGGSADVRVSAASRFIIVGPQATALVQVRNAGPGMAHGVTIALIGGPGASTVSSLPPGAEITLQVPIGSADPGRKRIEGTLRFWDSSGWRSTAFAEEVLAQRPGAMLPAARNPFVVGKPLSADSPMFFGRVAEMDFVERALSSGDSGNVVVLVGQRRTGKTSFLRRLEARLAASYRYHPVFIDVQGMLVPDTDAFFRELARRCMLMAADGALPDDAAGADLVRAVAERSGRRVVLLLDEFDDLDQKMRAGLLGAEVFSQFRTLVQHSANVSVVLCGTHRLEELAAEHWSFLLNLAVHERIGFLDRCDAGDAIRVPLAGLGIIYDEAIVDKAVRLAGRHPYLLQLLGYRLVEAHMESGDSTVGAGQLDRAAVDVVAQGEIHLQYLWQMAGDLGRQVIRALASTNLGLAAHELRRATGIDSSHLSKTLRDLTAGELVTEDAGRFAIGIGLLSRWITHRGLR